MSKEVFDRGFEIRKKVLGAEFVEKSFAAADDFNKPMQELVTEYCWGAVWGREELPHKTRSMLNIAMLSCLNRTHELKMHVKGAIRNGVTREETEPVLAALKRNHPAWVDFMMRFELGLEAPDPGRAVRSASTIAASYIVGGLIPLAPYMVAGTAPDALRGSVAITLVALLIFGGLKGRATGTGILRSALQTMCIGGLAAAAAFGLAHLLSRHTLS